MDLNIQGNLVSEIEEKLKKLTDIDVSILARLVNSEKSIRIEKATREFYSPASIEELGGSHPISLVGAEPIGRGPCEEDYDEQDRVAELTQRF